MSNSEVISGCCGASMLGEPSNLTMINSDAIEGRCSDCCEMSDFIEYEEELFNEFTNNSEWQPLLDSLTIRGGNE